MGKNAPHLAFKDWIGKSSRIEDSIDLALSQRIAKTLADDTATPQLRLGADLPPLWHWCFFQTPEVFANLSDDGHPKRGGFLPPISLPRRMWAGGSLEFHEPLPIGAMITRESRIDSIEEKEGRTGPLVFVTLKNRYTSGSKLHLEERQDLVFREAAERPKADQAVSTQSAESTQRGMLDRAKGAADVSSDETSKKVTPHAVNLFRYSALTFNSHRIHYDREYAKNREGYDGLVVQGPLLATQLCEFASSLVDTKSSALHSFDFRAQQATLDQGAYFLRAKKTELGEGISRIDLRVINHAGAQSMSANAVFKTQGL